MGIFEEIACAENQQAIADLWDKYNPEGVWTEEMMLAAKARLESAMPLRCRMCARPPRWLSTQLAYAAYCAGKACSNRDRVCQRPDCCKPFALGVDGAGTKYCSTECKVLAYHPTARATDIECAWGGEPNPQPSRVRRGAWPYICVQCLDPIAHLVDRLKSHHVSHDVARRLLDDPTCEICERDIVEKIDNGHGKRKSLLVVDHDHGCCPADSASCGRCVRGLICGYCNSAAGMVGDSPSRARRLADYLERYGPTEGDPA